MSQTITNQPRVSSWKDNRGRNWDISITFKTADGRETPVSITIDSPNGHGLTREVLREFPFRQFAFAPFNEPSQERPDLQMAAKKYSFKKNGGKRRGALKLEDEEIQLTKEVFLHALRTGQPTIKTIAIRFGISHSAANKRIMKLRREGFLPPSRLQQKNK